MFNTARFDRIAWGFVIVTLLIAAGCSSHIKAQDAAQQESISTFKIGVVLESKTTADLQRFFKNQSLGGDVKIQTQGRLVFVQVFPYSGIDASHLIVYANREGSLKFLCFLMIPSQREVNLTADQTDSVEIRADSKKIATLSQPATQS